MDTCRWRRRRGELVGACMLCGAAAAAHKWLHVGCVAPPRRTSGCMQVEYALQTSREVCVGTILKHFLKYFVNKGSKLNVVVLLFLSYTHTTDLYVCILIVLKV